MTGPALGALLLGMHCAVLYIHTYLHTYLRSPGGDGDLGNGRFVVARGLNSGPRFACLESQAVIKLLMDGKSLGSLTTCVCSELLRFRPFFSIVPTRRQCPSQTSAPCPENAESKGAGPNQLPSLLDGCIGRESASPPV